MLFMICYDTKQSPRRIEQFRNTDELHKFRTNNVALLAGYHSSSIYEIDGKRIRDHALEKAAATENCSFLKFKEGTLIRLGKSINI